MRDLIDQWGLEPLSLTRPTFLARGQVYLVRLRESMALPDGYAAYANSKSSTGRIDLTTRVLCDGNPRYDRIPGGYRGELWLEIQPRSFDVIVQSGISLNQAIVFRQRSVLGAGALQDLHAQTPLAFDKEGGVVPAEHCLFDDRLILSADLSHDVAGFVAKRSHQPVNLSNLGQHAAQDYFDPIMKNDRVFLERGRFYILATKERVKVPAEYACEMVPYDPAAGEFRAHYAGFFDPGWGCNGAGKGAAAVLEVRPHEDDLILRHGQPICAMAYEKLTDPCTDLYGSCGNNYAEQTGPRLSKYFTDF